MLVKPPFAGLDRRVAFLRATLLSASLLGIIASWPAWFNARLFPLVQIARWFPVLSAPSDKILLATMLAALVIAFWRYRLGVITFLAASLFAFCEDQNRGQPWLYMYWVMLALSLPRGALPLAACRIALCIVYFWSGVQKLNPRFFEVVPGWFVTPAIKWHWPAILVEILKAAVAAAPFVEIAIAVLLWGRRARPAAIAIAFLLHSVSLIFLGPLGYNYNWVVWPWNAAMMALVWGLFSSASLFRKSVGRAHQTSDIPSAGHPPKQQTASSKSSKPPRSPAAAAILTLSQTLRDLRGSQAASIAVLLFGLLPILSFFGLWDSYFSFSLYAENAARANIFVTQPFADRLPSELRKYVQPFTSNFDPQHQ